MTPFRLSATSSQLPETHALMQESFAFMEGRVQPPSSIKELTQDRLADLADNQEVWCLGAPVAAAVVLSLRGDVLYIGKLAVHGDHRGRGLARALVDHAERRAHFHRCLWMELQVRVELVENQRAFQKLGFTEWAQTAHPGFDRVTSLTFRRPVESRSP
ncbi:GNAT family N-acetyltransferase [Epibacterium sp. SM1979]|uniref:GNAT family N-acetyltransferase n=1 Tax=Tritonibacter litoralis TaxID=2662264 RepID=A0A843YDC9_9RHOB|nr:GNAT family N-acetyltransferase [Tritonibacter litoralis]MQQ07858.1 GNAT family N-acetyltransferase [Tritonibacter litoralis]